MAKHHITVKAVRREPVDLDKLVSALLLLIAELDANTNQPAQPADKLLDGAGPAERTG